MQKHQAMELLTQIFHDYHIIKEPKYRNANLMDLKGYLDTLDHLKDDLKDHKTYKDLVNGISQTINRIEKSTKSDNTWRNTSERGINKAIRPVVNKPGHPTEFPFEWKCPKSGQSCFINDHWGARNFMVMDVIGYIFLLDYGCGSLPKEPSLMFNDFGSIGVRESLPSSESINNDHLISVDLDKIKNQKNGIKFTDADFRKYTSLDYSSNQIRDLLYETSKVEFKLVFPVRMMEGEKPKEKLYQMNIFSKLFEFGYIDRDIRHDGIVQSREYYIFFNTILGELFLHNLLSGSYDWVDSNFYMLPANAQAFYRQFILHHDKTTNPINLVTIKERLRLLDTNPTNLLRTIEENILKPLIQHGFILSYEKKIDGFMGTKFTIKRPHKKKKPEIDSKTPLETPAGIGGS